MKYDTRIGNQCGRPTKSGRPCQAGVYGHRRACGIHETDVDRAWNDGWDAGWDAGWNEGKTGLRPNAYADGIVAGREAEEERWIQANTRLTTSDGSQIIQCSKGYAYAWRGEAPLSIGDKILLPGNWLFREQRIDVVSALGTTYTGALSSVIKVIEKAGAK